MVILLLIKEILLPNDASKRTLTSLYKSLEDAGCNTKEIEMNIADIVTKTAISLEPFMTQEFYAAFGGHKKQVKRCFHIFGFDILLDRNNKAWLLEINALPSLNIKNENSRCFYASLFSHITLPFIIDIARRRKVRDQPLLLH